MSFLSTKVIFHHSQKYIVYFIFTNNKTHYFITFMCEVALLSEAVFQCEAVFRFNSGESL